MEFIFLRDLRVLCASVLDRCSKNDAPFAVALLAMLVSVSSSANDGERLYREGNPSMTASVLGERRAAAPCADCHRRSREGAIEGTALIPPLTARALFNPRAGHAPRPAYTRESLATAIRTGIDPAGRVLNVLMPRYTLDEAGVSSLTAYLAQPIEPAPGLSTDEIRFATVVGDDVSVEEREALVNVMQAFIAERNRDTRVERFRRGHDPSPRRRSTTFKRWSLSVWTLNGASSGWRAQLERYYREQPVFAVLSGLSNRDWQPVHDFCEDTALPCVFPQTPWPGATRAYYNLYLSRGALLDIDVIASHLRETGAPAQRLLQVYGRDLERAADAFRESWGSEVAQAPAPAPDDDPAWQKLFARHRPDVLLLWLRSDELPRSLAHDTIAQAQVFASHALTARGTDLLALPQAVQVTFPYRLPVTDAFARHERWLAARNLDRHREIGVRALFACATAAEALAHLGDRTSRELFLERLEHMNDSAALPSIFAHASLGPNQRVLAKGAAIVRVNRGKIDIVRAGIIP